MRVKNSYGTFIEEVDGELSGETKKTFPECIACWENSEIWGQENWICGHYGPCNLYPLLKKER
jgi:hypothetical protein